MKAFDMPQAFRARNDDNILPLFVPFQDLQGDSRYFSCKRVMFINLPHTINVLYLLRYVKQATLFQSLVDLYKAPGRRLGDASGRAEGKPSDFVIPACPGPFYRGIDKFMDIRLVFIWSNSTNSTTSPCFSYLVPNSELSTACPESFLQVIHLFMMFPSVPPKYEKKADS
jgi:hypothetical protein